jgi:hypothetical protein
MLVIRDNFISDPSTQKANRHQNFNFPDIADSPRQIQRIEHVNEIKSEQSYGFNEKEQDMYEEVGILLSNGQHTKMDFFFADLSEKLGIKIYGFDDIFKLNSIKDYLFLNFSSMQVIFTSSLRISYHFGFLALIRMVQR